MAPKRLIVAVEGTAALEPFWKTILSDYLDKIIRCFCQDEPRGQKTPTSEVELSLVMFNSHGPYSGFLVQRTGWTKHMDLFLQSLSTIRFAGGGFNDAAIAEGLAEALMLSEDMLSPPNGIQDPNMDGKRHCILVAASNPYLLPTPVYRPQPRKPDPSENIETKPDTCLFDAETLAKSFDECAISLSVICPKQLPKLRSIYNAGKCNPEAVDPPVDKVKNPHFLVLISGNLFESHAALSRCGLMNLSSNQNPPEMDVVPVSPVSGPPPTSIPSATGPVSGRQPLSPGNLPSITVKVEPASPAPPHVSCVPRAASPVVTSFQASSPMSTSQEMIARNENVHEMKPVATKMSHSLRPVGGAAANVRILNDVAQARQALSGGTSIGLPSVSGSPMLSSMISSGMASPLPLTQTVMSSGVAPISGSISISGSGQVMQSLSPGMSGTSHIQSGLSRGNFSMTQMVQTGLGMNQNTGSAHGIHSGTGLMVPTPGMQTVAMSSNNNATNMPFNQSSPNSMHSVSVKYIKVWEGNLSGQRQGQPVFISRLEGFRYSASPETIAADWPSTMQIVRLISEDYMNMKPSGGDIVVFRALNQHGFLKQLHEKKLCAVIQLTSQTLLIQVSDKAARLIGRLYPGDMVIFKHQIPNQPALQMQQQQPLMQMQQQARAQIQQQHQISRLQQQQQQQQHMIGTAMGMGMGMSMGQGYIQGGGRPQVFSQGQISSQGQVSSQGQQTMHGAGPFTS